MELHFLGTGGYHPNERRHTACVMLPELGVVFDAGTGAFRIPSRLRTDTLQIFLSHAHLDHICGLTYLLVPMLDGRLREVRVWGAPAVIQAVREHLFAEAVFPKLPENLIFQDITQVPEVSLSAGYSLRHQVLVSHPGGSRGFLLANQGAPQLAYITDTTVDGSYDELISNVPWLIHECYFANLHAHWAKATGHSTTGSVGELAARLHVGRLTLVHTDPLQTTPEAQLLAEGQVHFPRVEIAQDGDSVWLDRVKG